MNPTPFESEFLESLTAEARDILKAGEGVWESQEFLEQTVIFKEGDASHDLYFIVKGEVEITKQISSDPLTHKLLAVLSDGAVFGEGALLSGGVRSATVRSVVPTQVLMFSQSKFDVLVREKPSVAVSLLFNLLRIVNQRLISTNSELVMLYDISQMLRDFPNDLSGLIQEVATRLRESVHVARGVVTLENPGDHRQQIMAQWGELSLSIDELEGLEVSLKGYRERIEEGRFIVPLRNFEGKFWGLFVLEIDGEWTSEQRKLVRAVAEPLGIAIEDYYYVQQEADRSRLQQKSIQF